MSIVTKQHIATVLRNYLAGSITAAEVANWAESVELQDEIAYDPEHKGQITDALFQLSSPGINGALTVRLANEMLRELNGAL